MKTVEDEISFTLDGVISSSTRRSLFNRLGGLASTPIHQLSRTDRRLILLELEASIRLFAPEESPRVLAHCTRILDQPLAESRPWTPRRAVPLPAFSPLPPGPPRFAVAQNEDISRVRLESWSEAVRLGFGKEAAIQIASTAAELARTLVTFAGRGTIELLSTQEGRTTLLEVIAQDDGPGVPPEALLRLAQDPQRGEEAVVGGRDLAAVRRLAGDLHVDSRPGMGTTIVCRFRDGQDAFEPLQEALEPLRT